MGALVRISYASLLAQAAASTIQQSYQSLNFHLLKKYFNETEISQHANKLYKELNVCYLNAHKLSLYEHKKLTLFRN